MTRRRFYQLVVPLAVLGVLTWFVVERFTPWTPTPADADRIAALEVVTYGGRTLGRTEDKAAIRRLLESFQSSESAVMHKCGDAGEFVFVRTDGKRAVVPYLPGHDPNSYEVRPPGQWLKVPKAPLLAAVKSTGVTEFPQECQQPPAPLP